MEYIHFVNNHVKYKKHYVYSIFSFKCFTHQVLLHFKGCASILLRKSWKKISKCIDILNSWLLWELMKVLKSNQYLLLYQEFSMLMDIALNHNKKLHLARIQNIKFATLQFFFSSDIINDVILRLSAFSVTYYLRFDIL